MPEEPTTATMIIGEVASPGADRVPGSPISHFPSGEMMERTRLHRMGLQVDQCAEASFGMFATGSAVLQLQEVLLNLRRESEGIQDSCGPCAGNPYRLASSLRLLTNSRSSILGNSDAR